ncbi:MAG: elongation factor G, partial [Planctomycetaceae bacterium]|jgi:elongation factor G|nr:elongation factor G [Planctomycetaceae bacterium]
MSRNIKHIRNIGIIAHIDAGKTTVTERMLYYSNFVHKVGMVDQGTTVTDYDPEEQERGITIQAAAVTFDWKNHTFNLIDTPGHVDFTAEVERSLRVLDGGVVVFSAREGVEAQSETVWRQANKYHVPRIAFINKMDREGADFYRTLNQIKNRLGAKPIVVAIPVGAGPPHIPEAFRATIDLITMKMLTFSGDNGSQVTATEIPDDLQDEAIEWRSQMLDDLSMYSDELTEILLAEEEISDEMIHGVLRAATINDMVVPVLCGSALDGIGVQPVMDAINNYLPAPLDIPDVQGQDPTRPDCPELSRKADLNEPFCGLIFKIQADKHGDLHYIRIYSGTLKQNSRVLNPREDKKENVPQLWRIQADRREQITEVSAGDICGVIGLRFSVTGDTLCDVKHPILLESIVFPETVVSMAIEPNSAEEYKKLKQVLDMMKRQDPTFRVHENDETSQMLISGMGELHLEVIKHRLLREYKVNVRVHNPRVSYRESIQRAVEVQGICNRNLGGQKHWAELRLRLEPLSNSDHDRQGAVEIASEYSEENFDRLYKQTALESIREESLGGGQLGFPLMNVKMTLLNAQISESESTETAFRIAVSDAFHKGLREAGIVLLEPIMKLEISTPDDYVGDIVSDLQQRRGIVTQTEVRGHLTIIEAEAPLANLFGYTSAIRGLSQGRASNSMEPLTYGPAPPDVIKSFMLE